MRHRRLMPALALLACITGPALAHDAPLPPVISMSGQGEIAAAPDMAIISLGVSSFARKATDAVGANNKAMAAVMEGLKAAGIAEKDLRTESFSVNPRFEENNPRPVGYDVTNQLTAKVRNLADLGSILDKAVDGGANLVGGISFAISNPEPLLDEARKRAFADAERKARLYAEAAGRQLGPMEQISEGSGAIPYPRALVRLDALPVSGAVPVAQGEESLSIQLNVTWRLE